MSSCCSNKNQVLLSDDSFDDVLSQYNEKEYEQKIADIKNAMINEDDLEIMAEFFKSLSDKTRISIVNALLEHKWLCGQDLCAIVNMSKSAISHQMATLRLNKLVKVKRQGQRVYYALSDEHVEQVVQMAISHIKE